MVGHCSESGLTSQGAKVVGDLSRIKLSAIVKDYSSRDAKVGDDVFPNKFPYFGWGDRGDSLLFDPFCEVVHGDE